MKNKTKTILTIILVIIGLTIYIGTISFLTTPRYSKDRAEFMIWALGEDWQDVETKDIPDRWNQRHGDIFTLSIDDDIQEGNDRMYKAYLEHFEEGSNNGT